MIFRQLFDRTSSTYTYLLAGRKGGEALLIDPVLENTDQYVRLLDADLSGFGGSGTVGDGQGDPGRRVVQPDLS